MLSILFDHHESQTSQKSKTNTLFSADPPKLQVGWTLLVDRCVQISPEMFDFKYIHLLLRCFPHLPPHLSTFHSFFTQTTE